MREGERIDHYTILKEIGHGGMGDVYLVHDQILNRDVALKLIHPAQKRHFLQEAHLELDHPYIVPIYEINVESLYFTMPYIEGKNLKDLINEGNTSVSSFCEIFLKVCQAVQYAHSKGMVHRDLKPSNILVEENGDPKILDWGLSGPIGLPSLSGTVVYMAPERMYGEPANFSTEVYSLGLMFYQMLTLHYPYHRENPDEYRESLLKEVLPDPRIVAPFRGISRAMGDIALKCLAMKPEDRYSSVAELIQALEKAPSASEVQELIHLIDQEMGNPPASLPVVIHALVALLELGEFEAVEIKIHEFYQEYLDVQAIAHLQWVLEAAAIHRKEQVSISFLDQLPKKLEAEALWPIIHILKEAVKRGQTKVVHEALPKIMAHEFPEDLQLDLDIIWISAYLLDGNREGADAIFQEYSQEVRDSSLAFLYNKSGN